MSCHHRLSAQRGPPGRTAGALVTGQCRVRKVQRTNVPVCVRRGPSRPFRPAGEGVRRPAGLETGRFVSLAARQRDVGSWSNVARQQTAFASDYAGREPTAGDSWRRTSRGSEPGLCGGTPVGGKGCPSGHGRRHEAGKGRAWRSGQQPPAAEAPQPATRPASSRKGGGSGHCARAGSLVPDRAARRSPTHGSAGEILGGG